MNRNILPSSLLVSLSMFPAIFWPLSVIPALADQGETGSLYVGVAEYYDNRKCVVTSTHDDLIINTSAWQNCLSMLTEKKIYHTVGVITNHSVLDNDWDFVQYWLDQEYTEAGSHSRNHVHAPYTGNDPYNGRPRISYEWQINGSKNDIIGNLTLPDWWRCGDRKYVYAWIEPYGSCDDTVRQWLGYCHYLSDRLVGTGWYDFSGWDSSKNLFHRVGYTVEMGNPPWGGDTSVSSLNAKFDTAYNNGKIYHLITHPGHVNWGEGSYADQHTDYISNKTDVWYVPFGLLYLYRWVAIRNIVNLTSTGSGQNKIFKLSINETDHQNYGISYPITYVFNIPSNWMDGYVYYRYVETDPWILMENKSSEDFFNGIMASRFDFANHKAYVSTSFSNVSHEVYLQLRTHAGSHDIAVTNVTPSKTVLGKGYSMNVTANVENQGDYTETFNVTAYANTTVIQTKTMTLTSGNSTAVTFTWNTTSVPYGNYTISATATPVPDETDTTDNTLIDDTVIVTIPGDVNGDGIVDIFDALTLRFAYWSKPGEPNWIPDTDLNQDDFINSGDALILILHFGETV